MPSVGVSQILSGLDAGRHLAMPLSQRLVVACAAQLPVTGVGLVLMNEDGPAGVVAASDGPAQTMEELQFTLGEGPCVESSELGRAVLVPDLARTGPARWPAFTAGALEAGICAIFAFPLRVGGVRLGVLDLYRDRPGLLSNREHAMALDHAEAATAVLLHLQADASPDGYGLAAIEVIEDRAEVHQATGIVAAQADVNVTQALLLLRARAYADNVPVLDLARAVLARTTRFDPP